MVKLVKKIHDQIFETFFLECYLRKVGIIVDHGSLQIIWLMLSDGRFAGSLIWPDFCKIIPLKSRQPPPIPFSWRKKDNPSREKNHYWCRCIKEPSFPLKILRSCWLMIFSSCWAVTPPEWRWKGYFVKINFKKLSFDHAMTISFAFSVL